MRCLAAVIVLACRVASAQSTAAPGSYLDVLSKGEKLTAAEAEGLESALRANPENIETRGKLIAYYFVNVNRESWARHVFWVIERHPEAPLAGYNFAIVPATPGFLSEEADAARARSLWLDAVKRRGDDGRVLANAAAFFSQRGGDESAAKPVQPIHVPGAITKASLISKVEPVYPPLAKQARIQGTVRFAAIIGEDGHIEKLQVISGHPLLIRAAQKAVRQYVYKPVLLNGRSVEVMTDIDVLFTLGPTFRETPARQQTGPRTP